MRSRGTSTADTIAFNPIANPLNAPAVGDTSSMRAVATPCATVPAASPRAA